MFVQIATPGVDYVAHAASIATITAMTTSVDIDMTIMEDNIQVGDVARLGEGLR